MKEIVSTILTTVIVGTIAIVICMVGFAIGWRLVEWIA